jgi:hypothetical protein
MISHLNYGGGKNAGDGRAGVGAWAWESDDSFLSVSAMKGSIYLPLIVDQAAIQ